MAKAVKIFDFTTSPEGWQFSSPSWSWNPEAETHPSALKVDYSPSEDGSGTPSSGIYQRYSYAWWQGEWHDLGVPENVTVTNIQLTSIKWKVTSLGDEGSVTNGPIELYRPDGVLKATLLSGRIVNDIESDWNTSGSGLIYNVSSELKPSTSVIELRIQHIDSTPWSGFNQSYYDDLALEVTYSDIITGNCNLSKNVNLTSTGTVTNTSYSLDDNISLFIDGANYTEVNSSYGLNLVIKGDIEGLETDYTGYGIHFRQTPSPTLFIKGRLGTLNEAISPLNINGFMASVDGAMNLFIEQRNGGFNLPLFINGLSQDILDASKHTNLLISGSEISYKSIPLTVYIDTIIANSVPLYINTPSSKTYNTSLYTQGPLFDSRSVNLFLKTAKPSIVNSNTSLVVYGGSGGLYPTWMNLLPLIIEISPVVDKRLSLFIDGNGTIDNSPGNKSNFLNLIIKHGPPEIATSTSLFLMNNQTTSSAYSDLYIRGFGKNPGYYPSYDILNLFVEGVGSGTLSSPVFKNLITTFIIKGGFNFILPYHNIVPLYIDVIDGYSINTNSTLFIGGANPPMIYENVPLVIYKTSLVKLASLYIHGF